MLYSTLFTAFVAIVFFAVDQYAPVAWLHAKWPVLLVFYLTISFLTHRLVDTGLQGNRERFIPLFLASTVARLVLGLAFVGFFLYQGIDARRTFVLNFLVLYIIYTGFEMWAINRKLRQNS
ncbi:hypothetical protein [Spirosoma montaniterrae]|uniref:Uncharacterized protein n=1 Tax=Spirosoma montaniterrae TaxID=1178516 RepID=A0A1P9WRH7_9BACT|nr:hypothetical protein [Spirosoma montaniterrae]AQG77963.1 hypothetical protein AWR27_00515 [Spirosoma montaniterrae]